MGLWSYSLCFCCWKFVFFFPPLFCPIFILICFCFLALPFDEPNEAELCKKIMAGNVSYPDFLSDSAKGNFS